MEQEPELHPLTKIKLTNDEVFYHLRNQIDLSPEYSPLISTTHNKRTQLKKPPPPPEPTPIEYMNNEWSNFRPYSIHIHRLPPNNTITPEDIIRQKFIDPEIDFEKPPEKLEQPKIKIPSQHQSIDFLGPSPLKKLYQSLNITDPKITTLQNMNTALFKIMDEYFTKLKQHEITLNGIIDIIQIFDTRLTSLHKIASKNRAELNKHVHPTLGEPANDIPLQNINDYLKNKKGVDLTKITRLHRQVKTLLASHSESEEESEEESEDFPYRKRPTMGFEYIPEQFDISPEPIKKPTGKPKEKPKAKPKGKPKEDHKIEISEEEEEEEEEEEDEEPKHDEKPKSTPPEDEKPKSTPPEDEKPKSTEIPPNPPDEHEKPTTD
jgi:hypothetical protein